MATTKNPSTPSETTDGKTSTTKNKTASTTIDAKASAITDEAGNAVESSNDATIHGISPEVKDEMSREINEMLSFAVYNGKIINTDLIPLIEDSNVASLINAHNMLCANIAPATPKSIEYTVKLRNRDKDKSLFSKLPLVRNLVLLAIAFLAAFIATSLSSDVNDQSLDKGVMNNDGISLLLNLGYLASVSGLGVVFYLLKNVSSAVRKGTLVPEDSIYYVALVVLGVISGLIMSEILNLYTNDADNINLFNKSVLALVGGFSSDAIFTVLQSLIDRLKAIFAPAN
ncbi:hypothetical protein ACFO3O_21585 [Dokdonia ponticola]|uniref:Uncharacterized protein n=1 Tax=Dokdonia ponticola TaxID=2041041 RepID=A0ABV9I3S0_9FLAO